MGEKGAKMDVTSTADMADRVVSAINNVTALLVALSVALSVLASAIMRLRARFAEARDEAAKLKSGIEAIVSGTEDALAHVKEADPKLYRKSKDALRAAIPDDVQEVVAPIVEDVVHVKGGKPHSPEAK